MFKKQTVPLLLSTEPEHIKTHKISNSFYEAGIILIPKSAKYLRLTGKLKTNTTQFTL